MQDLHRYRGFEVRPLQRQLLIAGRPAPLGARAFDVLLALIERPGQLLTKSELLDRVWAGRVVEENNLVVQVGTLRKLLGAEVIATIPGRGYRFAGWPEDPISNAPAPAPTPSTEQRPTLPEVLPPLFGRDDELAALGALITAHRLITIVGAGGMGKSRVAQQLLSEQRELQPQGVAWVELAGLSDPALLPGSIASALGLQIGSADPLKSLVGALRHQHMLLALDNAEHLLDAVAGVVRALLDGSSGLRVLVTSQVPLKLPDERLFRLGALAVPDGDMGIDEALGHGAMALFVERVQAVDRRFVLGPENLQEVIGICRQLDGLALAVELAAARVPLLGVSGLASALGERLQLLTGGRHGAPQRQRTLRAALDWTCALLTPQEQVVFRRLGIFTGGFTLEMARVVAADDERLGLERLDEWAVVDALGALIDRSLVVADTALQPRYRLLDSPRAYALERLAAANETEALQRRLAMFLMQREEHAVEDWLRLSEADWRARHPAELDNVRATIDWAFGPRGDVALGVAVTARTAKVWLDLGLFAEGIARLEAAEARIALDTSHADQARINLMLGKLQINGAPANALQAFERCVHDYRQLDNSLGLGHALVMVARTRAAIGQFEPCAHALTEALPLLQSAGFPHAMGAHADAMAFAAKVGGDPAAARRHFERALALYRRAQASGSVCSTLANLADTAWALGELDAALAGAREALSMLRVNPNSNKGALGVCLTNLAGIHTERSELDEALLAARQGLPLRIQAGYAWGALDHLALRAALAGKAQDAARIAGCTDAVFRLKRARRQPNEARARDRLERLLTDALGDDALRRQLAEGALLDIDEVCRLALAD